MHIWSQICRTSRRDKRLSIRNGIIHMGHDDCVHCLISTEEKKCSRLAGQKRNNIFESLQPAQFSEFAHNSILSGNMGITLYRTSKGVKTGDRVPKRQESCHIAQMERRGRDWESGLRAAKYLMTAQSWILEFWNGNTPFLDKVFFHRKKCLAKRVEHAINIRWCRENTSHMRWRLCKQGIV